MPTDFNPRKLTKLQGHFVCIVVAFIIGLPLWLIYRWVPDLLPFVIAWVVARPVFKIWQELA